MDSENRSSIEAKVKNLALGAAIMSFITALVASAAMILLTDVGLIGLAIGAAVGVVLLAITYFVILSPAANISTDAKKDASNLATAASAMAVGNFSATLRTDAADELGQIEGALAQMAVVQKELTKDVENFTKRHINGENSGIIDDKQYAGEYRDMVRNLNSMASAYSKTAISIEDTIKALENGEFSGRMASRQFDVLRANMEKMSREIQNAQSAEASLTSELEKSKEELANAKRDIENLRMEASTARSEANNAEREASNSRREADRAKSEVARLNDRLKSTVGTTPGMRTSMSPTNTAATATKTTPPAAATAPLKTMFNTPSPPPKQRRFDGVTPANVKSVKINAPSGAHVYDRRDFGKFS
jgi:methyl-accepting chemotaxis protein